MLNPVSSVKPAKAKTNIPTPACAVLTPVQDAPPDIRPDAASTTTFVAGLNNPKDANFDGLRKAAPV
jgi:hypothetical protein